MLPPPSHLPTPTTVADQRTLRSRLWTYITTRQRAVVGLLVPALLMAWIITRVLAVAPPPALQVEGPQRYGMSAKRRQQLFINLASHEKRWRKYGLRKFPHAPWSAEDDYHWHVQAHLQRTLSKRYKISNSQLWALYDEAVHDGWSVPGASPTKASSRRPRARAALPRASSPTNAPAAFRATVVPLRPRQH